MSHLSIKSLLGSEEGGIDQQMTLALLNKAFSANTTGKNLENTIKNPICFRHKNEVGSRFCGGRQTHIHTHDYRNPVVHASRISSCGSG